MNEATIIYPHQLFRDHPALKLERPVFLVEEPLFISEFPSHRQKALLHRLSLKAYQELLTKTGFTVTYLGSENGKTTTDILKSIFEQGFTTLHIADTTDNWLEKRLAEAISQHSGQRIWYESPLFLLPKAEATERYQLSKRHMARFYSKLRYDLKILLTAEGEPVGGQWSFDSENRKKLPKGIAVPADPVFYNDDNTRQAQAWFLKQSGEYYGLAEVWLPYTHAAAEIYLANFLQERLAGFGPYEDALSTKQVRLFHSTISPLLNIGLLTPRQVLTATLAYSEANEVPLASLEGFIRQIIGWREFIRAAYEADGTTMRRGNFWQHKRPLPKNFWTGETDLLPIDTCIKTALTFGYNHHIERLMVLGNFLLLSETNPHQVYRWFMAMYIDAYDWVMVPNVYGMSQFADGGLFATKPYISGSNYLRKMSDYQKGDWEPLWDALYWHFIAKHQAFFLSNFRLSMMPRLWANMAEEKRQVHLKIAKQYLEQME